MLVEDYLANCTIKGLAPKTIKAYSQSLYTFYNWLGKEIDGATKLDIANYISSMSKRGVSKVSVNNHIRNLRAYYNWLFDNDYICKNPMAKVRQIKVQREPVLFLQDEDIQSLLKAIDLSKYHEYRDKVVLLLLLDTGMRIGETLAITLDNVNFSNNSIYLPWQTTKGKKARTVFFSLTLRKLLKLWLKHRDIYVTNSPYLFPCSHGEILSVNAFERNLRRYSARVGIEGVTPKVFRNNFAKRFLMAGGDIYTLSRILGHSSVTVTEKAYLDITDKDLRERYQTFSPVENMKVSKW